MKFKGRGVRHKILI